MMDDDDLVEYTGPTIAVLIRYPPDREDAALLLARRLYADLDLQIESCTLEPGEDNDFAVWLDGAMRHSTRESGSDPSAARLVEQASLCLRGKAETRDSNDCAS